VPYRLQGQVRLRASLYKPTENRSDVIAAWNHLTFGDSPRANAIGHALVDYMRTGNVQALMMVLDVEWDARERAKGELDRKPNRINFTNMGFKETHPLKLVWQSGEVFIESIDKCLYWYTGRGNEKSRFSRIETVRQFLALCTLFGISPST
jgi:hypothetical protein